MFRTLKSQGVALVLAIVAFACGTARADDEAVMAQGYCAQMENYINYLVEFTQTKCIPGKEPEGMSFIFISEKPVLSVPDSFKAWMIVVTAAFGNTFNANSMKTSFLVVTDMNTVAQKKGFKIPAKTARALQKKLKSDQISLEAYYAGIERDMVPYSVK